MGIIVLIIFGIYIGMVMISLLSPYVDLKNNYWEKGKKYTLGDLQDEIDSTYWVMCFIPLLNVLTAIFSLIILLIIPLWDKIREVRIM